MTTNLAGDFRGYEPQRIEALESNELLEQLNRELYAISDAFSTQDDKVSGQQPERLIEGMFRFFDGSTYDPGLGPGLYLYQGGQWNKLSMTPVP